MKPLTDNTHVLESNGEWKIIFNKKHNSIILNMVSLNYFKSDLTVVFFDSFIFDVKILRRCFQAKSEKSNEYNTLYSFKQ